MSEASGEEEEFLVGLGMEGEDQRSLRGRPCTPGLEEGEVRGVGDGVRVGSRGGEGKVTEPNSALQCHTWWDPA